jgi:transcriptional regulator with XRE-family HTH domain
MALFREFGKQLQKYRHQRGTSITHVAQSIGVDRSYLSKLEHGHERPSITILNSLIHYYALSYKKAFILSCLIGYSGKGLMLVKAYREEVNKMNEKTAQNSSTQLNINNAIPVLYTDSVLITTNTFGLVFDFAQSMGPTNQQNVVARVGMSKEHAEALLKILQEKLSSKEAENKVKN